MDFRGSFSEYFLKFHKKITYKKGFWGQKENTNIKIHFGQKYSHGKQEVRKT
jgi:hypothetical protein